MTTIRASVAAAWPSMNVPHEGDVPYLYLDTLGIETVGIGCVVTRAVAQGLPFTNPDGSAATPDAIGAAWDNVAARTDLASGPTDGFAALTTIRLSEDAIEALARARLQEVADGLGARFPAFEQWSAPAQAAACSMGYAMGVNELLKPDAWPKWCAACDTQDWATAAAECRMSDAGGSWIEHRNNMDEDLFNAAAAGGDPDALTIPPFR